MTQQIRGAAKGAGLGRDVLAMENKPSVAGGELVECAIDAVVIDVTINQRRDPRPYG
jgi:hypothetical protein